MPVLWNPPQIDQWGRVIDPNNPPPPVLTPGTPEWDAAIRANAIANQAPGYIQSDGTYVDLTSFYRGDGTGSPVGEGMGTGGLSGSGNTGPISLGAGQGASPVAGGVWNATTGTWDVPGGGSYNPTTQTWVTPPPAGNRPPQEPPPGGPLGGVEQTKNPAGSPEFIAQEAAVRRRDGLNEMGGMQMDKLTKPAGVPPSVSMVNTLANKFYAAPNAVYKIPASWMNLTPWTPSAVTFPSPTQLKDIWGKPSGTSTIPTTGKPSDSTPTSPPVGNSPPVNSNPTVTPPGATLGNQDDPNGYGYWPGYVPTTQQNGSAGWQLMLRGLAYRSGKPINQFITDRGLTPIWGNELQGWENGITNSGFNAGSLSGNNNNGPMASSDQLPQMGNGYQMSTPDKPPPVSTIPDAKGGGLMPPMGQNPLTGLIFGNGRNLEQMQRLMGAGMGPQQYAQPPRPQMPNYNPSYTLKPPGIATTKPYSPSNPPPVMYDTPPSVPPQGTGSGSANPMGDEFLPDGTPNPNFGMYGNGGGFFPAMGGAFSFLGPK